MHENTAMTLAGIDGYKNGWVVVWDCNGVTSVEYIQNLPDILERKPEIAVIDIPIGLLQTGTREADHSARQVLKKRSCCVFTAPIRPMLECTSYDSASQCRLRAEGKSITKQSWAILPKIREVDAVLNTELQKIVREGHPEVSFALMNNNEPLSKSKHSYAGQQERTKLLQSSFPDIALSVEQNRSWRKDVIDACALLWTARRISEGEAVAFPENSAIDARGLLMQIWA
jgi:predicted RNase H-like nuclease